MIEQAEGDILRCKADALVNTVNCVGVMGRGIALQFKKAFPGNFKAYKAACDRNEVHPGVVLVYDRGYLETPRYILNFPTKRHWRGQSRLEDIEAGLPVLVEKVRALGLTSVALPPLGCGLGGLDWAVVRPKIVAAFERLPDVRVFLYAPAGAPAVQDQVKEAEAPKMTAGRAALLGLMRRYLSAVLDPGVTLLEVHKLMYFMQEVGQPLRLSFVKAPYGPYAENLRHVLNVLEGHFISGYDAEDRPDKELMLLEHAAKEAENYLTDDAETLARFEKVADLIEGFESAYGMELLATVHWVVTREGAKSDEEAITLTHAWNQRKQSFEAEHIRLARHRLLSAGLVASPS